MPEPVKEKEKCICQICTCGRHRCPHNPEPFKFGEDDDKGHSTEYNEIYKTNAAKFERAKPIKRGDELTLNEGAFEGRAAYTDEFKGWQVGKPDRAKPINDYHPPTIPFDGSTTLQHDYPEWEVHPREKRKQADYIKPEGDFAGTTTSQDDYSIRTNKERTQAIRPKADQVGIEGTFQGITTNQDDYKVYKQEKTESYKPVVAAAVSEEPFEGITTLKQDYPEWKLEERSRRKQEEYVKPDGKFYSETTNKSEFTTQFMERTKAIRPKVVPLAGGQFDGTTTNKEHYSEQKVEKAQAIRHKDEIALSGDSFQDATTVKNDYPEWEVHPREKRKHDQYVKPEGIFDDTTTSKAAYAAEGHTERALAIRHKDELGLSGDTFQDATTVKNDYPAWEVQPRSKRRQDEYVKPDGEFEGTTTNKTTYIAQGSEEKREAIRPKTSQKLLDGKFTGTTTSKEHYGVQPGEKAQAIRHKDEIGLSEDLFQDATTVKNDYPEWEVQPREKRKLDEYVKPEGVFDGTTTTNAAYPERPTVDRAKAIQPKGSQLGYVGKFEGTTTNNETYDAKAVGERAQVIRHKDEIGLSEGQFQDSTTVKNDYPAWEVQPRSKRIQDEYIKPEGEFENITTNNAAYMAHGGEKALAIRPKTSQKMLEGEFARTTTNNSDYGVRASGERTQAIRPKESQLGYEGVFDGITTNKAAYIGQNSERTEAIRPKASQKLIEGEFNGTTTKNSDYPEWEIQPREKRKHDEYVKPDGIFDGTTTNNAAYGERASVERTKAIIPKGSQLGYEGNFEGTTTSKDAFKAYEAGKTESYKPMVAAAVSSAPFDGVTTQQEDYPAWKVQTREKRKVLEYIKPDGEFDSTTTNKTAYAAQRNEGKREAIRPKTSQKLLDGDFQASTTSKEDYQIHSGEKAQAIRHKDEIVLSEGQFQDSTTVKNDYPEWKVQPRERRKHEEYIKPEGVFDGTTTNKAAYPDRPTVDRAKEIQPKGSQLGYEGKFEGTTTNSETYDAKSVGERAQVIRHKDEIGLSRDSFQDATTAKNDYPEWDVHPREKRKQDQYVKPEGIFDDTTTSRAAYAAEGHGEKALAIRHKDELGISGDTFQDATTVKNDYPEWEVHPREKRKQDQYVKPEGIFDDTTTSKVAYAAEGHGERALAIRHKDELVLSGDTFQDATTAKNDYPEWDVHPREKRKQDQYVKPEGIFDDTTTSKAAYAAEGHGERALAIRHKDELGLSGDTFQDSTTVKNDYPAWEVQPRSKRRQDEYVKPDGEFEGTTTNNATYIVQGSEEKREAIRPKTSQKLLDGKFIGTTTSKEHYGVQPGDKAQAIRHKDEIGLSEGQFQDATTVKNDYPEWEVQPREKRKIDDYVKPEGVFGGTTTTNAAYPARPTVDRAKAIQPKGSQLGYEGKFEGTTTNSETYDAKSVGERAQVIRHKDEIDLSGDTFQDATTVKNDYPEWEVHPREKRKHDQYVKPEGIFDDTTTSRAAYAAEGHGERALAIRHKDEIALSGDTFQDATTVKNDYPAWEVQPRSKRRQDDYVKPDGEFGGTTTNNATYIVQGSEEKREAIRPKTSQKLLDGKFIGTTTSKEHYGVQPGEKAQAIRHKDEIGLSEDLFQDATTVKNDYPEWEVQPRFKRRQDEYIKPEGELENITTNKAAYMAHGGEKTQAIRPRTSQKLLEGEFSGITTSNSDYKAYKGEKTESYKPMLAAAISEDPFDSTTTLQNDYPPWAVQPRHKRKQPEYIKPEGDFQGTTTNKIAYGAREQGERTGPIRPKTSQKLYEGEFEGTTTNKDTYNTKTVGEKAQSIKHKDEIGLSGDVFQDSTTSKTDYPLWDVQPRQKRKQAEYMKPEGEFEGRTTNKMAYVAKGNDKRTGLIRPKTSQKLLEGEFEGITTSKEHYGTYKGEKAQAIRHKDEIRLSEDPFNDLTTVKTDYPTWEVQPRQKRKQAEYMKPEGEFEGTTTNKMAYATIKNAERTEAIRPKPSQKLNEGEFEGVSTVKRDYPEWEVKPQIKRRQEQYVKPEGDFDSNTTNKIAYNAKGTAEKREAIRPKSNHKLYEGEFDGLSTNRDHYKAYQGEKTESFKPMVAAAVSEAPFDGHTTVKDDYPAWAVQPRQKRKQVEYLKPEGVFEITTTSKSAYGNVVNGEKRDAIRPKTSQKLNEGEFEGTTTSKDHYQNYRAERTQAIRPHDSTVLSSDPFDGSTTVKNDYPEWKVESRQKKQQEAYVKPEGEFYSDTTNKTAFKSLPLERTRAIRPETVTLSSGPFEGTTTHKSAFTTNMLTERTLPFKPVLSTISSSEPFDDTTTQKSHFATAQQVEKQKPIRQKTMTKITGDPFEGETTASRDYKQWQVPVPSPRRREVYVKPEGDLDMVTTQKSHYTDAQSNERSRLVRPTTSQKVGEGGFEGSTTTKGDYRQWTPSTAKKVTVVQEYKPPTDKFSATTTNQSDYPRYAPGDRSRAIKNVGSTIKLGNDDSPFAGGTSYRSQYLANDNICPVSLFGTTKSGYRYKTDLAGHKFYNPL